MYAWDVTGGACGASRDRDQALAVVGQELTTAPVGATAAVVQVLVSQTGVGYIPVEVIGRAKRTEHGVVWTETAAAGFPGGNPAAAPQL